MISLRNRFRVLKGVSLDKTIIGEKYSTDFLRGTNEDGLVEVTIRIAVTPYGRYNKNPYVLVLKRTKDRSESEKLELPGGKIGYEINNGVLGYTESIPYAARRELGTEIGYSDLMLQGKIGEADIVKKSKRHGGKEVDIRIIAFGSSLCYDAKRSIDAIPVVLNEAEHTNHYWMRFDKFAKSDITDEMRVLIDNGMHFSKLAIDYDCSNCYRMTKVKKVEEKFRGLYLRPYQP